MGLYNIFRITRIVKNANLRFMELETESKQIFLTTIINLP